MTEKQPKFFYKVEATGRVNILQDESLKAFNPQTEIKTRNII
ncbi:MAG: hypothetical protein AAGU06_03615 [Candidatus Shapirobacteria bacterium]